VSADRSPASLTPKTNDPIIKEESLRRIILIATAVGVLVAAGAAYAVTQINTYTATVKFTSKAAGTAKKPVPVGYTLDIAASGTGGNRTAILTDLKTKIYGLAVDQKDFPTCSLNAIANAKNDTICPKGALVASGYIHAEVGSPTDFTAAAAPCDPALDVWNSGPGKLTYFFVDNAAHNCKALGLVTGSTGPYPSTVKTQGKFLVSDTPIPSFVGRPLGLAGSLLLEHLVFTHQSKKVKGKTVHSLVSVACQGKKRPYSESFTANLPDPSTGTGGVTQTATVSHTATC
jgi:hypothetical protein